MRAETSLGWESPAGAAAGGELHLTEGRGPGDSDNGFSWVQPGLAQKHATVSGAMGMRGGRRALLQLDPA